MSPQPWSQNDSCMLADQYACPRGPVVWSVAPIRRLCVPCHLMVVGPLPEDFRASVVA